MFEFSEEIVEFKFKNKVHQVRKPNNKEIKEYSKELALSETDEAKEDALMNLLFKLGLDKEVFNALTPSQAKKLLEALYDSEKN